MTELWAFYKNIRHLAGASVSYGHISSCLLYCPRLFMSFTTTMNRWMAVIYFTTTINYWITMIYFTTTMNQWIIVLFLPQIWNMNRWTTVVYFTTTMNQWTTVLCFTTTIMFWITMLYFNTTMNCESLCSISPQIWIGERLCSILP